MGRKAKKGLDYFSHDCNHDNELKYIEVLHKNGYKVFFKLLEHIYGVEGYYCKADKKNIAIFVSDKLKDVDIEEVNAIINDCLSEHLFDKCLHKKYEILTSASIQRRFFEAIKRRSELELINEYILKDNVDINELNVNINWLNVDKSTQSKVKESKEENSKEDNIAPTSSRSLEPKSKIIFNFENEKWEGYTSEDLELWGKAYPACNIKIEFAKMKAWILAAGAKGHKSNWKRFVNNWLNNCQDRGGTKT